MFKNTGSTPDNPTPPALPSYLPQDQAAYTPVQDDRTGRTDQVSFGNRGIPSLGNIGVYDSSTNPAVGGNENPYPSSYPSKPSISFLYGQDTMSDNIPNLNFYAGGEVHGPGGYDKPSEGLLRGVEFVATYFSYAVASDALGGKVDKPNRPIAYFEQSPEEGHDHQHGDLRRVGFSRDVRTATPTTVSTYYWDFGDGSARHQDHPCPRSSTPSRRRPAWHDVKLLVSAGGGTNTTTNVGAYRQVEPDQLRPGRSTRPSFRRPSPLPPTSGPASDPCGTLSSDELASFVATRPTARCRVHRPRISPGLRHGGRPTLSLTLGAPASFGAFTLGVAKNYDYVDDGPMWSRRQAARRSAVSGSQPPDQRRVHDATASPPSPSSKASWTAPVSHDPVTISFHQPIAANDALRTGTYSATETFTLSTTDP